MYDVVIIGAGMSGLAAGIRLAMFGQRVCILERHYAVGGLNSYYRLEGRNYDVGLHALTNFAPRGAKQGPLPRLLRALRIGWDELELAEQTSSVIAFPEAQLRFNNDPSLVVSEIERRFPSQLDGYHKLLDKLLDYNSLETPLAAASAREVLSETLSDPLLAEMLLCPVMFYGSPREHDLDWGSFSVLFRSIFLEGLCRPRGGIRTVIKHLVQRFKQSGGEIRLRAGVREINSDGKLAAEIVLDDGEQLQARQIISSAGWNETMRMCAASRQPAMAASATSESSTGDADSTSIVSPTAAQSGRMTFIEAICTLDCQPRDLDFSDTIVFYNDRPQFNYAEPDDLADVSSGIVCTPNNYQYESDADSQNSESGQRKTPDPSEGTVRLTALANFDRWAELEPAEYQQQKQIWRDRLIAAAERFIPNLAKHVVAHDTFTPTTVRHFTGHDNGAVYGAPQKRYDASTHLKNLWVCGADQGYVGIVGTITSGIHVANKLLQQNG